MTGLESFSQVWTQFMAMAVPKLEDRRPHGDSEYGSEPAEELSRAETVKIPVGVEVYSEDFEESPTVADRPLPRVVK